MEFEAKSHGFIRRYFTNKSIEEEKRDGPQNKTQKISSKSEIGMTYDSRFEKESLRESSFERLLPFEMTLELSAGCPACKESWRHSKLSADEDKIDQAPRVCFQKSIW